MTTKHPVLAPEGTVIAEHNDISAPRDEARRETGRGGDLVFLDGAGVVVSWSATAILLTGLAASEVVGKPFGALCGDGGFTSEPDPAGPVEVALPADKSTGDDDPVRVVVSPDRDSSGALIGYRLEFLLPAIQQITDFALTGAAPLQHGLQDMDVQESPAFLVEGDDLLILDSNQAASLIFGRPPGKLVGLALQDVLDAGVKRIREESPGDASQRFLRLAGADGGDRSYSVSLVPVRREERDMALCVLHELTEMVSMKDELIRTNQELSRLARHDHLTGLFNRPMFQDTLEMANSRLNRQGGLLGVLYIDLDSFKPVNDRFGHDAGDTVLIEVARRLKSGVRSSDVVARLGGDEFGAILENLNKRNDALKVARYLIACLGEPFEVAGQTVRISASIGAVVTPRLVEDASTLVAQADRMMYEAKSRGHGHVALAPAGWTAKRPRTVRQT